MVDKLGRGAYAIGVVKGASIASGDSAFILKRGSEPIATVIMEIRDHVETPSHREQGAVGDRVALLLRGVRASEVAQGDVISATETEQTGIRDQQPAPARSAGGPTRSADELKGLVGSMSMDELIAFIKGLTSEEEFVGAWLMLLGKLQEHGYNKFEAATVLTEFAGERIGSQSTSDIAGALVMSSGNAEPHLPLLLVAGQQYQTRTFGSE
ncbi:MAG: hypothetical protein LBC97_01770 [Bifidobacteriaceae bacterium]|nr:hypothetical protein [Bifidobacteriaceae bacterium]